MPPAFPPVTKGNWHLHDAQELAREHGVNPQLGLPAIEAGRRAEQLGPNEIQSRV